MAMQKMVNSIMLMVIDNDPRLYLCNDNGENHSTETDNSNLNDSDACIFQMIDHHNEQNCKTRK